jgi:hypothetical protein
VDLHSWINTALSGAAILTAALSIAYVRIIRGKTEAKVTIAKADADAKLSDRDQVMREYGLLLSGIRGELERERQDKAAMWKFQMNRAKTEYKRLEQNGTAIADVLVEARDALAPIRNQLADLYASISGIAQPERDRVMTLAIVRNFDDYLVEHLCEPYNMTHGECLLIALAVAKNGRVDDAHTASG